MLGLHGGLLLRLRKGLVLGVTKMVSVGGYIVG